MDRGGVDGSPLWMDARFTMFRVPKSLLKVLANVPQRPGTMCSVLLGPLLVSMSVRAACFQSVSAAFLINLIVFNDPQKAANQLQEIFYPSSSPSSSSLCSLKKWQERCIMGNVTQLHHNSFTGFEKIQCP